MRQPQNPLGTRSEINFTINWVRSHLEMDPNVSIPKQDVYDEYVYVLTLWPCVTLSPHFRVLGAPSSICILNEIWAVIKNNKLVSEAKL